MSSGSGNDHAENFLLFVVVSGLVLSFVIYVGYLFLPFLIFYFLPFVVVSLVVGAVLRMAGAPENEVGSLSRYKALVMTYAVMLLIVGLVFFKDITRSWVVDKKGKPTGDVVLDWPELNKAYNDWHYRVYVDAPFEGLRKEAKVSVIYDRMEVGWICLVALFLGGPMFYEWLARSDEERVHEIIENLATDRVASKNKRLNDKESNLDEIIRQNKQALEAKIQGLEAVRAQLKLENESLKARLEFAPEVRRPSEKVEPSKKGVLDGDWL
jgi:hypothetical protein